MGFDKFIENYNNVQLCLRHSVDVCDDISVFEIFAELSNF